MDFALWWPHDAQLSRVQPALAAPTALTLSRAGGGSARLAACSADPPLSTPPSLPLPLLGVRILPAGQRSGVRYGLEGRPPPLSRGVDFTRAGESAAGLSPVSSPARRQ